jgi:hypothetical protein
MARRAVLAAMLVLAIAAAGAAAAPQTPAQAIGPEVPPPVGAVTALPGMPSGTAQLTPERATEIAGTSSRLRDWLADHPAARTAAIHDREKNLWTVDFIDAKQRIQAQVLVDDAAGTITETRTGPQVAWQMARGYKGAFGRAITEPQIWIPLLALFLIPLLRWRRIISWHTLDLVMLAAFSVSLVWFNRGEIFTSVPLAYPPMAYLAARLVWIATRRGPRAAPADPTDAAAEATPDEGPRRPRLASWCPTWLLVCLMLVAVGLRVGLNAFDANVIDVGYAGVIGADRIAHGQTPYGTFPGDCGQCDTYGPVTYLTYVPFEAAYPWIGKWNDLPAAHAAAVFFDLAALIGMLVLGWRLSGRRLAAGLGLAWAAFPFTAYALESNSNDSLVAACLVWGLVVAHRPMGRGVALGLAALTKFTPAILLVLWARHPFPRRARGPGRVPAYLAGLVIAVVATGWVVLLDGEDGLRAFWSRTIGFQLDRESPFSLWGQYTWLRPAQIALGILVLLAAVAVARWPRQLDLRGFAALSGALILGVQLTMTHWFYLYIPWFLPFALVAMVPEWPARVRAEAHAAEPAPVPRQVVSEVAV